MVFEHHAHVYLGGKNVQPHFGRAHTNGDVAAFPGAADARAGDMFVGDATPSSSTTPAAGAPRSGRPRSTRR
jgi:hypothetical protein